MNKTQAKKYLVTIKNSKIRHLTSEKLSRVLGIYPEKINEDLSVFEPLLAMDPTFNLKDLLPSLDDYVAKLDEVKINKPKAKVKKTATNYKSIGDFVYKKMTVGGLVDRNIKLSEVDLKVLRNLVDESLDEFKGK